MQKILVVEDDIIICGGLKVFLEGKGFEVMTAHTVSEARKALADGCDLVLLDIHLPDGSGLKLCQEIRSRAADPEKVTCHDTICRRVSNRVDGLRRFAGSHDVILFVAGKKSSNGRVLFNHCLQANGRSHLISNASELRGEWFEGADSVGIAGATSTPRWLMEEVKNRVSQILLTEHE